MKESDRREKPQQTITQVEDIRQEILSQHGTKHVSLPSFPHKQQLTGNLTLFNLQHQIQTCSIPPPQRPDSRARRAGRARAARGSRRCLTSCGVSLSPGEAPERELPYAQAGRRDRWPAQVKMRSSAAPAAGLELTPPEQAPATLRLMVGREHVYDLNRQRRSSARDLAPSG